VSRVFPKDPTRADELSWFAVTIIVTEKLLLPAIEALRRAGASDITATPVRYVFERKSWTFEALRRHLTGDTEDKTPTYLETKTTA
jgi:hypothetical protein